MKKSGRGSSIFVFYCIFKLQFFKVFWGDTWGAPLLPPLLPPVCIYGLTLATVSATQCDPCQPDKSDQNKQTITKVEFHFPLNEQSPYLTRLDKIDNIILLITLSVTNLAVPTLLQWKQFIILLKKQKKSPEFPFSESIILCVINFFYLLYFSVIATYPPNHCSVFSFLAV
jgi:hypothetical protein